MPIELFGGEGIVCPGRCLSRGVSTRGVSVHGCVSICGLSAQGCVCVCSRWYESRRVSVRGCILGGVSQHAMGQTPPVDRQKHYLSATTVTDGKNVSPLRRTSQHLPDKIIGQKSKGITLILKLQVFSLPLLLVRTHSARMLERQQPIMVISV